MPNIETKIVSVTLSGGEDSEGEYQLITMETKYYGATNLSGKFTNGHLLDIEIPSHAPPPAPKKGKK